MSSQYGELRRTSGSDLVGFKTETAIFGKNRTETET